MVSLPTCSIILFGLTSSNVRPLFTQFLGKLSISAFPWEEGFAVAYSITDRTSFNSALQIISAIHEQKKTKNTALQIISAIHEQKKNKNVVIAL